MRKALLALAFAAAVTPTTAHAATPQFLGGCRLDHFDEEPQGGDHRTGTLSFAIALYDASDPLDNPVSADVSCEIQVNGVVAASTPAQHVTGAGASAFAVAYIADWTAYTEVCTVVSNWSDGSPDVRVCPQPPEPTQVPPQEVTAVLNAIFEDVVDPAICPVLASSSPGVPGVVDINAQGDVVIAGEPFWDCPPYGPSEAWGAISSAISYSGVPATRVLRAPHTTV